jgi:MoaA/NifB/PqqE/SkfB family radical SAM enzyme
MLALALIAGMLRSAVAAEPTEISIQGRVLNSARMQDLSYKDFVFKFSRKAKRANGPWDVAWELTQRCNLDCPHCYIPIELRKAGAAELDLGQVKLIIDELAAMGCYSLSLTGGEIFTRKDVLQILEYLRGKGLHLAIQTNGTLITDSIGDILAAFNPLPSVAVSLYSLKEEQNERIVGVQGALKKTLEGIGILKRKNIPVTVGMLVMKGNLEEFDAIKEFAASQQIHFQYDYVMRPCYGGSKAPLKFQIPLSAIRRLKGKEKDFLKQRDGCGQLKDNRFPKDKLFYCEAGRTYMAIDPYGQANMCLDFPFPSLSIPKEGLRFAWQKVLKFAKSLKPNGSFRCYKCSLGDFCAWCPAMAWRHRKDLNACLSFYKRLAGMEKDEFYDRNQRD